MVTRTQHCQTTPIIDQIHGMQLYNIVVYGNTELMVMENLSYGGMEGVYDMVFRLNNKYNNNSN